MPKPQSQPHVTHSLGPFHIRSHSMWAAPESKNYLVGWHVGVITGDPSIAGNALLAHHQHHAGR